MFLLLLGLLLGVAWGCFMWLRLRRRIERIDEERQHLSQEKQIVVDFMHNMADALGEGVTRDGLFDRIVHTSILSTGALAACVFEAREGGVLQGVAVEGLFPPQRPMPPSEGTRFATRARFIEQVLRSESFPMGEGIVGLAARTRRAVLVADALSDPRVVKHDDPALAVCSLIAAPILFQERLIGVLAVVNPSDGLPFSETDFSLVQSMAEQAGLAVNNLDFLNMQVEKRQLDLDLDLARSIQQMLLPSGPPDVPGVEVDARYIPAQRVGGDLYDLIRLPGGRLGVAVADVSGKGVSGSLLMAICRTNLRQIALRHTRPAAALAELNRSMAGELHPGVYITLLYAIIDPGAGEVTFARAGHELPLLCRVDPASGRVSGMQPGSEGMPLNLVEPAVFDSVIVDRCEKVGPGDVLVLYTDGITEAANAGDHEFSAGRLSDVVCQAHARPVREINDSILETVAAFTGLRSQRDDMTLVTVRIHRPEGRG